MRRKGAFIYSWWECKLVKPLYKWVWKFHTKLKLPHGPAIPLLGTYQNSWDTWTPMIITAAKL
jgi:hypothetical protein